MTQKTENAGLSPALIDREIKGLRNGFQQWLGIIVAGNRQSGGDRHQHYQCGA